MRAVWLSELDENDEDGNVILTGVFDAHAEIGQRFEDASGMTVRRGHRLGPGEG